MYLLLMLDYIFSKLSLAWMNCVLCLQAELEGEVAILKRENAALRQAATKNSIMLAESKRYGCDAQCGSNSL